MNTIARVLWSILAKGEKFDPAHARPTAAA